MTPELSEETVEAMRQALAEIDAAWTACPVNSNDPRQRGKDACIRCLATVRGNCGANMSALISLETVVRALISPPTKEGERDDRAN